MTLGTIPESISFTPYEKINNTYPLYKFDTSLENTKFLITSAQRDQNRGSVHSWLSARHNNQGKLAFSTNIGSYEKIGLPTTEYDGNKAITFVNDWTKNNVDFTDYLNTSDVPTIKGDNLEESLALELIFYDNFAVSFRRFDTGKYLCRNDSSLYWGDIDPEQLFHYWQLYLVE